MLPEISEVIDVLKLKRELCPRCDCEAGEEEHIGNCSTLLAIRLQVTDDDWIIHHGDPGFDLDHHGHWGATTVALDDDDEVLDLAAQQLLNEVEESLATEEEWAH